MKIKVTKGKLRYTLTCIRRDGSSTTVNLGPNVPNHDFTHFIVENKFKLKEGFFGTIKAGKMIAELSGAELIKDVSPETWLSEILARNLQSLQSGAVAIEQFAEIVRWEAKKIDGIVVPKMNFEDVRKMKQDFDTLCKRWSLMYRKGLKVNRELGKQQYEDIKSEEPDTILHNTK
ncbi:hypothetical protein LCGC14_0066140 [marine sediment metagenome]|uniref:Uncharacterized protein n=1 Tax=marine sediment metagenome TaxID=412755 RepID=A0A0F9VM30_9ZZZZ|nr:hypothetical protein [Maribacter sp.]HDZ05679.1 hypothetical protein [Maribacter sp.]HEA70362.1 hypothetical protein [archaeon]